MQKTELQKFHAAIKLAANLDPYMTITRLEAFLAFASIEDITSMEDLRDYLALGNISNSATYRNISYWHPGLPGPAGSPPQAINVDP